jgi:hypothetical protein
MARKKMKKKAAKKKSTKKKARIGRPPGSGNKKKKSTKKKATRKKAVKKKATRKKAVKKKATRKKSARAKSKSSVQMESILEALDIHSDNMTRIEGTMNDIAKALTSLVEVFQNKESFVELGDVQVDTEGSDLTKEVLSDLVGAEGEVDTTEGTTDSPPDLSANSDLDEVPDPAFLPTSDAVSPGYEMEGSSSVPGDDRPFDDKRTDP